MEKLSQEQIDDSAAKCQAAASQGYAAYSAAKAAHADLIEAYRLQRMAEAGISPSDKIYIVGKTYAAKKDLARMGCTWSSGHNAWVGTAAQIWDKTLPTGCRAVSQSSAALRSMDTTGSDY